MNTTNKEWSNNTSINTGTLAGKKSFGLRFKMFIYFVPIFVLSIILMNILQVYGCSFLGIKGEYYMKRSVKFHDLNLVADLKKERLNRWLRERVDDARIATENYIIESNINQITQLFHRNVKLNNSRTDLLESLQKESAYKHLTQFLKGIKTHSPAYNSARIVDIKQGFVIASSENTDIGAALSTSFHEKMLVSGGEGFFTVKNPQAEEGYGLYLSRNIETSHELKGNDASAAGLFLVMSINSRDFAIPIIHTGHGLGKTGEALLVDNDVKLLTPLKHPLKDGSIARAFEYKIDDQPATLSSLGFEGIVESVDYSGEQVLAAFRHIVLTTDMAWGLVVKQNTKEIFAILYDGVKNTIIISLAGIVIIFLITIILANKLSRPINILTDTAYKVSSGNLKARASVTNKDAIGFLAQTFNTMVDSVESRQDELESKVRERTQELTALNNELQESENKYHDLYDNSPDMLLSINPENAKIISCNKALLKSLCFDKDEIIGRPVFDIYHPDCLETAKKGFQRFIEKGEVRDLELQLKRKDGGKIDVSLNVSCTRDNQGNIIQSRSALRDITKHKTLERELAKSNEQLMHSEKLAAIGKLSASIAHEFNNPICGIKNVLETVAEANLNEDEEKFTVLAIKECHRMADLIRKLQDFNRPSSGDISLINLHEIIDEVLLLTGKKLKERDIIVQKNYVDRPPLIKAVNDQIKQVFLNLIQNAEEAIVGDGGTITITSDCVDSNILIHIKDTGGGIPPQFMSVIFEPFYTSKPAVKGTGLGLSVCHGIVKKFGGDIKVDTEVGKGTTFTVIFPVEAGV